MLQGDIDWDMLLFPQHAVDLKAQFKKILATEYTAVSTPIQHAAVAGFEISKEMDEYFEITRNIHQMMGEYTHDELLKLME